MNNTLPYSNSYWVEPGKLLAGEYPGSFSSSTSRTRLRALLEAGIRTFIDLTRPGDTDATYEGLLMDEAAELQVEVERKNIPVTDFGTPGVETMKTILDLIDASISTGRPVYVHCIAGRGRTGTVVGCYLVRHGMSGADAIDRIEELRQDTPDWLNKSPEVPRQIQFVEDWEAGA